MLMNAIGNTDCLSFLNISCKIDRLERILFLVLLNHKIRKAFVLSHILRELDIMPPKKRYLSTTHTFMQVTFHKYLLDPERIEPLHLTGKYQNSDKTLPYSCVKHHRLF